MHTEIFGLSTDIRYVAIYQNGHLSAQSKSGTYGASGEESDKYEELLVNPTLLKLTSQRGNVDCGGLNYVIVRYGNFFQFVLPMVWGHVSVCIEPFADPVTIGQKIVQLVYSRTGT